MAQRLPFLRRTTQPKPALKALAGAEQAVDFSSLKTSKILQMRNDPYLSAALAGEMLTRDRTEIAGQIGRDLTSGETYLIHFLGKDDARRFMQALETNPGASAAKLLSKVARANRPIFYAARRAKTVHEVHQTFEDMMRMREDRYRGVAEKLPDGVSAYTPANSCRHHQSVRQIGLSISQADAINRFQTSLKNNASPSV